MALSLSVLSLSSGLTLGTSVTITSYTSSSSTAFVLSRASGDTEARLSIDVDGQLGWGPGGSTARDTWLYRSGVNILSLASSSRVGNGGTLILGNLRCNTSTATSNTHVTINGSVNIGTSNTVSASSTNYNLTIGDNNTISSSASRCFVGGTFSTVNGSYNFAYGDLSRITTTGSNNFAVGSGLIQANGATQSNDCAVIGPGTISGSENCVIIGGQSASLTGRIGTIILSDNQASSISPGGDNMLQCRFNGNGVAGNAAYWFSSDVNSNGVRLNYQANSWGSISSDSRLKNKLYEMDYQGILNALDQVPCYRYTYKHDGDNAMLRTGFFADEFNANFKDYIVPQLAREHPYTLEHPDEEPINTYNFDDVLFVNYCGIKGLHNKIKEQQNTISELQTLVSNLLQRVTILEQK